MTAVLFRLAYLGVTNTLALLRLLPISDRAKDAEILAFRHQIAVLERHLHGEKIRFTWADRAFLAALLHRLPRDVLREIRLLFRPDTLLRSQADALLAADFIETVTLTGTRLYILTVIEHAIRRVRVLGATAHPSAGWVTRTARNLVMDLEDVGCRVKYLIRDRDGKYPGPFDAVLADAGITVVLSGVRMPRMNAVMERWVRTCRRELLDRSLIFNQRHLLYAPREYEVFYNEHRPHQGITNARPLVPLPEPITDPDRLAHLNIHRRDRLGGILHEYEHAA
jgi:transposase InsO family protein